MEHMTVCKTDMAVLPQLGVFAAEPFAFLAFAQGILARAQSQLGSYRPLSLIYCQDSEEQTLPAPEYVIQLHLTLPPHQQKNQPSQQSNAAPSRSPTKTERAVQTVLRERLRLEKAVFQKNVQEIKNEYHISVRAALERQRTFYESARFHAQEISLTAPNTMRPHTLEVRFSHVLHKNQAAGLTASKQVPLEQQAFPDISRREDAPPPIQGIVPPVHAASASTVDNTSLHREVPWMAPVASAEKSLPSGWKPANTGFPAFAHPENPLEKSEQVLHQEQLARQIAQNLAPLGQREMEPSERRPAPAPQTQEPNLQKARSEESPRLLNGSPIPASTSTHLPSAQLMAESPVSKGGKTRPTVSETSNAAAPALAGRFSPAYANSLEMSQVPLMQQGTPMQDSMAIQRKVSTPTPVALTHTQPEVTPSGEEAGRQASQMAQPSSSHSPEAFQRQPAQQAISTPTSVALTHTQPEATPSSEEAGRQASEPSPTASSHSSETFQRQPAQQEASMPTPVALTHTQPEATPSGEEAGRQASEPSPTVLPHSSETFQRQPAQQEASVPTPVALTHTQPEATPSNQGSVLPKGHTHSLGNRMRIVARDLRVVTKSSRAFPGKQSPGGQQRQGTPSGSARLGAALSGEVTPFQELTYVSPVGVVQEPPVSVPPVDGKSKNNSLPYLQELPGWAQDFLQESFSHPQSSGGQMGAVPPRQSAGKGNRIPSQPAGISFAKSAPKGQEAQTVWTAPGYMGTPAKMTHKEKTQQQELPPLRVTDAEIRRVAGKVYQLIEDRMKRDRRRMGL